MAAGSGPAAGHTPSGPRAPGNGGRFVDATAEPPEEPGESPGQPQEDPGRSPPEEESGPWVWEAGAGSRERQEVGLGAVKEGLALGALLRPLLTRQCPYRQGTL